MASKNPRAGKSGEVHGWKDALGYVAMRLCDSAYLPWALVAGTCVGMVRVLTCNLNSKDTLALLRSIGSLSGLAWSGWAVALLGIPVARYLHVSTMRQRDREIRALQAENATARRLLIEGVPLEKPDESE